MSGYDFKENKPGYNLDTSTDIRFNKYRPMKRRTMSDVGGIHNTHIILPNNSPMVFKNTVNWKPDWTEEQNSVHQSKKPLANTDHARASTFSTYNSHCFDDKDGEEVFDTSENLNTTEHSDSSSSIEEYQYPRNFSPISKPENPTIYPIPAKRPEGPMKTSPLIKKWWNKRPIGTEKQRKRDFLFNHRVKRKDAPNFETVMTAKMQYDQPALKSIIRQMLEAWPKVNARNREIESIMGSIEGGIEKLKRRLEGVRMSRERQEKYEDNLHELEALNGRYMIEWKRYSSDRHLKMLMDLERMEAEVGWALLYDPSLLYTSARYDPVRLMKEAVTYLSNLYEPIESVYETEYNNRHL